MLSTTVVYQFRHDLERMRSQSKMAASMYRSCLMSSRNFRINVRQFNSLATKSAGLNTKRLLIGVPCACVLLWEARRQLRLYYGFSPALQAKEPESEVNIQSYK